MRSLQLRHSQTPESAQMARAASALDLPLHANLGIMAQRRRRLLRQAHKSAPQTRRVSIRRRGRHQPLRRRDQCRPQTLRVDRTPKPHPRRCQKREGKVRVDPLAALVLAATVYIGAIARPDPYPIPAKDAQARFPESKETRVNSFTYQAADPTNAGPRYWRRSVSGDGWVERTPAGDESFFQIDKRTNYGGCDGTVVSKIGEPNFQLLIPDRGCPNMELKFRRSTNGNWMGLPRMENIL